jgi:hypothetical protein
VAPNSGAGGVESGGGRHRISNLLIPESSHHSQVSHMPQAYETVSSASLNSSGNNYKASNQPFQLDPVQTSSDFHPSSLPGEHFFDFPNDCLYANLSSHWQRPRQNQPIICWRYSLCGYAERVVYAFDRRQLFRLRAA